MDSHRKTRRFARTDGACSYRTPILVVEDEAHRDVGHYPELFAEVTLAIQSLGHPVAALTARGWSLEGDPSLDSFDVSEFCLPARKLLDLAETLERGTGRNMGKLGATILRSAAIVVAARMRRRSMGGAAVILTGRRADPFVELALAGHGRWLLFRFDSPADWVARPRPVRTRADVARSLARRTALRVTRSTEQWRESRGGLARIVVNNDTAARDWEAVAPWLQPTTAPFALSIPAPRIATARAELGLPADARLALSFGAPHSGKDLDSVYRAFSELSEWTLVVAGNGSADAFRAWAAQNPGNVPTPVLIDGYVDRRTRALLYSAADVAVLSFRDDNPQDSGTLVNCLTFGVPVVCSDEGNAGDVVDRHGLGVTFRTGDSSALVSAMRVAPSAPDADGLDRARAEFSADAAARRLLDLLEVE